MAGRKKGQKNATPEKRRKFFEHRRNGLTVEAASEKVGMSKSWGSKLSAGAAKETKVESGLPEPKTWAELDGGVKDTLKSFPLFQEVFLARRRVPWAYDAAMRVLDCLANRDDLSYVVINTPPGAGKSTLFTKDIPAWLICGGGVEDPEWGRALRMMLGHKVIERAEEYVLSLRAFFALKRPFYDVKQKREAELVPAFAFGRFKPSTIMGEDFPWSRSAITVAQVRGRERYQKEPTVQAASADSSILAPRVDFFSWDDLVATDNASSVERSEALARKFEDEAESRLEPGGVGLLVGQRLSNLDLFRNRLDQVWVDDEGVEHKKYQHIVYPAHFDDFCDGEHRQWDGTYEPGHGCLLDEFLLPWKTLLQKQASPNYRTVFQQEDADPGSVLIQRAWLEGGTDEWGYPAPGCYDYERGFFEWPPSEHLFNYVTVDPSTSNFWAIEWWALDLETRKRYLIYGARKKMQAGAFLDWDPVDKKHVGLMENLQLRSGRHGQPIYLWIIEQVSAYKGLFQNNAFTTWRRKWSRVEVLPHETQRNKRDAKFGVEALLPMAYRSGMKSLPRRRGDLDAINYVRAKENELTKWPFARSEDTVMCDWFGETNMTRILETAARVNLQGPIVEGLKAPRYLERRAVELDLNLEDEFEDVFAQARARGW